MFHVNSNDERVSNRDRDQVDKDTKGKLRVHKDKINSSNNTKSN